MVNYLALMGRGKVSFCDISDVVQVISTIVLAKDPLAHAGKVYTVTGPDELSIEEIAATILEQCESKLIFDFHYNKSSAKDDERKIWMDMLSDLLKRCNEGYFAMLSKDAEMLTGLKPKSFVDWLTDNSKNKELFQLKPLKSANQQQQL